MSDQPFIVTLVGPVATLTERLAEMLPAAKVLRELGGDKAVIMLPAELADQLWQIPGVSAVAPDELRRMLRPGRSPDI